MRSSLRILVVYAVVAWTAFSARAEGVEGMVVGVLDGEQLVVRKDGRDSVVRILGVSVPETHRKAVADALSLELLNRQVLIEHDVPAMMLDGRGSRMAYVYRLPEGTLINHLLVRQGLGVVPPQLEFQFRRELTAAQSAARLEKRGLWSAESSAAVWESRYRNVRYLGEVNYQTLPAPKEKLATAKEKRPVPAAKVRITNRKAKE